MKGNVPYVALHLHRCHEILGQEDVLQAAGILEERTNLLGRETCHTATDAGDNEGQMRMCFGKGDELVHVGRDGLDAALHGGNGVGAALQPLADALLRTIALLRHAGVFVMATRKVQCACTIAFDERGDFFMRLDKYLKVSRLIKRRTVANEACDAGRVLINGKVAKAGSEVKVGDKITINFGNKDVSVRVLEVVDTVKKEEAKEMFEYL